ncbi:MAG: glycosyltransferase [Bacteroidetes bacterium]|nr:glycosyltransferase [Bacteroidota bacterium]
MLKTMSVNTSAEIMDVVFALTGDPQANSRALRQLQLLADSDFKVLAIGLINDTNQHPYTINNVTFKYLPRPSGSGPQFFWKVHKQLMNALKGVKSKIFHASDLYTLPAICRSADRQRSKVVFDARELYTHLPATIKRPWVGAAWKVVMRRFIVDADCVFSVSQSIADHLKKHYQLDTVHLMHNVPDPCISHSTPSLRQRLDVPDHLNIILHQGNLQAHRGCSMMVESMRHINNGVLVFMGQGPLRMETKHLVNDLNLESKVRFLDPVPPDQLLGVTSTADLGLTFLEDSCLNHRYALPNKLFEYLTAGIPVISSDLPEITRIIKRFNVGCVVPSGDAHALGMAIQDALQDSNKYKLWAQNTCNVVDFFNFRIESEHFLNPYLPLLES